MFYNSAKYATQYLQLNLSSKLNHNHKLTQHGRQKVCGIWVYLIEAEWRIYASVNLTSLVQIMACRLFGAKPLSEPMMEYC